MRAYWRPDRTTDEAASHRKRPGSNAAVRSEPGARSEAVSLARPPSWRGASPAEQPLCNLTLRRSGRGGRHSCFDSLRSVFTHWRLLPIHARALEIGLPGYQSRAVTARRLVPARSYPPLVLVNGRPHT